MKTPHPSIKDPAAFLIILPLLMKLEAIGDGLVPVRELPDFANLADLLSIATADGYVTLVVRCRAGVATTSGTLFERWSWAHFREARFGHSVRDALARDQEVSKDKGLHIRMTRHGLDAIARHRLGSIGGGSAALQSPNMPQNETPSRLAAMFKKYHVDPSTLRRAVKDGRLKDYRPKAASKNAPLLIAETEVAALWPMRKS